MDNNRARAHRAYDVIKGTPTSPMAYVPGLYKKCLDGVELLEQLKPQVEGSKVPSAQSAGYNTPATKVLAEKFATLTIDNVLTIILEEKADHKWSWCMVL